MSNRWLRLLAVLLAFAMVAAACGDDDDDTSTESDTEETDTGDDTDEAVDEGDDVEEADEGAALALEGDVEVATGTTLRLGECPDDWDPMQGVDGDEIILGQSLPESGPLASFGAIGEGMQMYFDYVNDTAQIEGKDIRLVTRDDAYEAGRAVANVQEMLDTEDIFSFVHMIGTPINLAVRPITDENCVPQLFNASGFPFWGDPATYPWNVGNILNYVTETEIWCAAMADEFGDGVTVAALITNNDFGTTYLDTLKNSDACAGVDLVGEELHDQAGDSVQNEMTTLIATDAQVFIAGVTGAFCSQAAAAIAASEWRPRYYNSYTCGNLASFFAPVQDAAGLLADEGAGIRMTNSLKVCGDPRFDDDPAIQLIEQVLNDYGDGTSCADGSFSTGVLYGQFVESVLRSASELPGGLNRVNLMAATWNADVTNDNLLGGTLKLDGTNDAYWTEAAQIQEVQLVDGALTYVDIGDVIDVEGEGGTYQG